VSTVLRSKCDKMWGMHVKLVTRIVPTITILYLSCCDTTTNKFSRTYIWPAIYMYKKFIVSNSYNQHLFRATFCRRDKASIRAVVIEAVGLAKHSGAPLVTRVRQAHGNLLSATNEKVQQVLDELNQVVLLYSSYYSVIILICIYA
jgi:hypothetical protein